MTAVLNGMSSAFSRPNAAPVLWTRVRLKNPGMIVTLSNRPKRGRTAALTAWSTRITSDRDPDEYRPG